jgi:hypothetical protein
MKLAALLPLPLLLAAAPDPFPAPRTPTAVLQISCRQGQCVWQQLMKIERIRASNGEVVRKVTSRVGRSTHSVYGNPPARAPKNTEWERGPGIDYVRCSKRRPATATYDAEDRDWRVTQFNLTDLGGYQYGAATLYMQVCHNVAPGKWRENRMGRLGYGKTASDQSRYGTEREMLKALD